MADEVAEQQHCVLAAATRQQLAAQCVTIGALEAALGIQPFHRVRIQHLAPDVGVVAGGVATHDVAEIRQAVARRHGAEVDPLLLQHLGLEGLDVVGARGLAGAELVQALVDDGSAEVGQGRIALVEALRTRHLVQQFARHQRTALIVLGIVGQHAGPAGPDLVDLGWVFDEVARHAGQARVAALVEHVVQRMAELMEHRFDLIPGHQRGLTGRRLGDVEVVGDHRLGTLQRVLADVGVHPRATALAGAGVQVGDENGELLAVVVEHVVDTQVVSIDRQVRAALERDAIELLGREKNAALQHAGQFQVGLELALVEAVLGRTQLVGVMTPVPGLQGKAGLAFGGLVAVDELLQLGRLLRGRCQSSRRQAAQQGIDGIGRLRGFVLQHKGRWRRIAEQCGALLAQRNHARQRRARVEFVAARPARHRGAVQALAQRAVLQHGLERLDGGVQQSDEVLAVQTALFRVGGRRSDLPRRQAGQLVRAVNDDGRVVDLGEHSLVEGRRQRGELGIDRFHARFLSIVQQRAGAHHVAAVALDQALGFGIGRHLVARRIDGLDAGKQLGVEQHGVAMRS
mmetsp:Transcript_20969/g.80829  ORF Transcript_20969/g.80829 Transcript_20969/m.80829 type:complete len:572 (-) Transcript_20969:513-2228(-)